MNNTDSTFQPHTASLGCLDAPPPYSPHEDTENFHQPSVPIIYSQSMSPTAVPLLKTQQPVSSTTIIQQVVTTVPLQRSSTSITCPSCRYGVTTSTSKKLKPEAWICCVLLCLCGCELCCWIPLLLDSNYQVVHTCPHCQAELGTVT